MGKGAKLRTISLLNQESWKHRIWHAGCCPPKFFGKIDFDLMASSLRRHMHIFEKWHHFGNDVTGGSNFVHVCFMILSRNMPKSK